MNPLLSPTMQRLYLSLLILFGILEFLTVIASVFRLAFRYKIRRFWWEDMWVAVAMIGMIIFAVNMILCFQAESLKTVHIAGFVVSYAFTTIVWSVRMSLLYSIIRIIPHFARLYRFTRGVGALFIAVWVVLLVFKSWWCVGRVATTDPSHLACYMDKPISIFELVVDFAADATLVVLSLRLFWKVKLPRRQRRMILAIFSSSAIMSMSSLPHCISQIINVQIVDFIFTSLEVILALIVCNLLVVVMYLYRVYSSASESGDSSKDDDFTAPITVSPDSLSSDPLSFTTVDLSVLHPTTTIVSSG